MHTTLDTDSFDWSPLIKRTLSVLITRPDSASHSGSPHGSLAIKTYRDLEWDNLLHTIERHTTTSKGALLAANLPVLPNAQMASDRMQEIVECMQLLDVDNAPPIRGWKDIDKALAYVSKEGILIAEDLDAIARNCDVASRCARYFRSRLDTIPRLSQIGQQIDACNELREVLNYAVEPGGRLSDQASPDLGRLRRTVQNQHDRLQARVEAMLRSKTLENALQDDYFTIRDDRYVLPIRAGGQGDVTGIVHGYSSSGQTAFIEPTEIIELNNQLRWAQIELLEEENRILERLSSLVRDYSPILVQNGQLLAYLDLIVACARVSRHLKSTVPEFTDHHLELLQARHPLLYLKMDKVIDGQHVNDTVPNDIQLADDKQVLIISGPNTGGKTVTLKTLGLCALMARCGLPIPVRDGSKIPFFRAIYTDIGDEQSIERDLSTFSGHLVNINSFIDDCDHQTLILLDELFAGTDPMQGTALAVSLLEHLANVGAHTAVTTHMEDLKTLAYQSDRFINASMGFDLDTLAPTYEMTMGIPGSSYAVRIAERLGFPSFLIDRANNILEGQEHHSIEEVIAALEDQMQDVRKERIRLQHERHQAERAQQKFKKKYNDLLSKERESIHEQTRQLRSQLRQARDVIRQKLKELQQRHTVQSPISQQALQNMQSDLKDSEKLIEHATELTRPKSVDMQGLVQVRRDDIESGMTVFAQPFKRNVVIVDYTPGESQAMAQIGSMKAQVDIDKLYYASENQRRAHIRGQSTKSQQALVHAAPETILLPQTSDNTVDLRGMRVDEAVEKLEFFLDSAYLQNIDGVYIIHGHGTGALKRAVRAHLPESAYVQSFRRGERQEGGDGVTIAFIRSGA